MKKDFTSCMATFFYVGQFPFGPGTLASVVGMFIYMILQKQMFVYLALLGLITFLGLRTSGRMEKKLKQKDPGCVVIDEVAGVMIAFYGLPLTWATVFTTFFLFRAFDMFKIYPCNIIEKKGGAYGIMMDDIVAGVYANLIMQVAVRWAGII
jgi:phosphatidylglycerophosphatase A